MENRLQQVFRDVFDDEEIKINREMTADDIDGWDSFTHFQLIMEVETEFDIKFTTEEISGLKSVGQLIDLVKKYTGEKK